MTVLRLDEVGFGYDAAACLLRGVSATFGRGWTAVVGPNGCGKSTLLRLVSGELQPREGRRTGPPPDHIVRTEQRVDELGPGVRAFARDFGRPASRWRARLALEPEQLERWSTCSPGERRRWQLGAALARDPAVLLLDEPTNHVDADTRHTLERALGGFHGIGLLVTHDRALLALSARTLWLERGRAQLYDLSYDGAVRARAAAEEAERGTQRALRREVVKLERRLQQEQQRAAKAERTVRTSQRMKGPRDSDARSALSKGRAAQAAAALSRRPTETSTKRSRVISELAGIHVPKSVGRSLFVNYERAPKSRLVALGGDLRTAPCAARQRGAWTVERESRVWIAGANGVGKTTLLRSLLASARLPAERVLWLAQDRRADQDAARAREIAALPPCARARVYELLAALGADPEGVARSVQPSPGEGQKLELALGLARQVWLVALDEPTNHLDLASIERLTAALAAYPGALLIATHDEAFAAALTTERWELAAR